MLTYVVGVYSVFGAWWFGRLGRKVWRGEGPLPSQSAHSLFKGFMYDLDRSLYVMSAFHVFFALMIIDVIFFLPHVNPDETSVPKPLLAVVALLPLAGMLASVVIRLCIGWFNVPKAFVPPHLRGIEGTVTARWARRRRTKMQRRS